MKLLALSPLTLYLLPIMTPARAQVLGGYCVTPGKSECFAQFMVTCNITNGYVLTGICRNGTECHYIPDNTSFVCSKGIKGTNTSIAGGLLKKRE
ncbi:hypothetical protein M432DRAFT_606667 [Thermoascus aurantiacus ATCC 26904]